jgi:hypothetical protein
MARDLNWADIMDKKPAYVVLTKENRLQVLIRPSTKQLRQRGKRGWSLVTTIDAPGNNSTVPDSLREAMLQTLTEMLGQQQPAAEAPPKKKKKDKT